MKALQKIEYQRMREEGQKAQSEAAKLFERGETDLAIETLQNYMAKVKSCQMDFGEMTMLMRPVEQRMATLKLLKAQKDSETKITNRKTRHDAEMSRNAIAAERAPTIARTIQRICHAEGSPLAASTAPRKANGNANSVCSILIISSVSRVFLITVDTVVQSY